MGNPRAALVCAMYSRFLPRHCPAAELRVHTCQFSAKLKAKFMFQLNLSNGVLKFITIIAGLSASLRKTLKATMNLTHFSIVSASSKRSHTIHENAER